MDKKCDIIITYCWNRVGYNILRSLSQKGLKVYVADCSKYNICSISKYASGSFIYPDPFTKENKFIETLINYVTILKPKILLPTHDESIIIAKHRDKFPKDLIIPIESYDKLATLSNKIKTNQLAIKAGLPVPHIHNKIDTIDRFPVVFKTAIGNSAKGVFFPKTKEDIISLLDKHEGKEIFIQEYATGCDHSVDCIRYGNYFNATAYKALVTKTNGGGTTTQRIIIENSSLVQYSKQFLEYIDYNGVCGLDFKCDENGNISFIECNARYTGGLATPIVAGFDIPYIHYCCVSNDTIPQSNIQIGTKTKWILGDFITLVERIMTFKLKLSDIKQLFNFGFDGFDDFDSNDKKAIFGELLYYFTKLVKNLKLNP